MAIDSAFLVMGLNEGEREDRRRTAAEHPGGGRKFHTFTRKKNGTRCKKMRANAVRRIARRLSSRPGSLPQVIERSCVRSRRRLIFRRCLQRTGRLRTVLTHRRPADVARRFPMLRDKRIEAVLRETRSVIARECGCARYRQHRQHGRCNDQRRAERLAFHDVPRRSAAFNPAAGSGSHKAAQRARHPCCPARGQATLIRQNAVLRCMKPAFHASRACT